jgi:predicted class III extradiol MEMO1 family dioxygenase
MSLSTDEDEHSIEMHLPYVRKVFEGWVKHSSFTFCMTERHG